jgi:type IV pilus assembly protein PilF
MDAVRNPLYRTPAKTYTTAGVCMSQAKRGDDAVQYFDRALSLDPGYSPAMIPLARLRMQRGELVDARALVQRFNSRGAPTAESLWLALLIERRRGDSQAEESFAAQLRRRFPDSKEVQALSRGQFE